MARKWFGKRSPGGSPSDCAGTASSQGWPDVYSLVDDGDVEGLIKTLALHSDWQVRRRAAIALGHLGDARAVLPLIAVIEDDGRPFGDLRWPARDALVEIGPPAVEDLICALNAEDAEKRYQCAWALGEIGDPRAVRPLIGALDDEDSELGWAAAVALGSIGDLRASKPLLAILKDEDSELGEPAAAALRKMTDALKSVPDSDSSEKQCPSCGKAVPAGATRCYACRDRFI